MKEKIIIWTVLLLLMVNITGCKNDAISDDNITITLYKGLEAEESEESVWQALLAKCTVQEYPQGEVEELVTELEKQYNYVAIPKGMKASELIEEIHGMSTEELAKEQLKKEYAIQLIAEQEGLTLTEDEYQEELQERATNNGKSDAEEYEKMLGKENLKQTILEEKVLEFLITHLK